MFRALCIHATIVALLGCPFRCMAGGSVAGTVAESSGSVGEIRSAGCPCCAHRVQPVTCDGESHSTNRADAEPVSPRPCPANCSCQCLCQGAVVASNDDALKIGVGSIGWIFVIGDETVPALRRTASMASTRYGFRSMPPLSGRLICFAVQSLLL